MKKDQNRLVWSKVGDESWRGGGYEINRDYNWTFDKLGAAKAACQADWHFAQ